MKRKVYKTFREKRKDQIIGMIAFPLIQVMFILIRFAIMSIMSWSVSKASAVSPSVQLTGVQEQIAGLIVLSTPWILNGIFIGLALLFRSQIGIGYMISFGFVYMMTTIAGVIFVAACFIALIVAAPFAIIHEKLYPVVGYPVFGILFLGALYFAGRFIIRKYKTTTLWPSLEEDSDE